MVRCVRTAHRRHRTRHAAGARSPAACLRARLPGAVGLAAVDAGAVRDRLCRADCANRPHGRDDAPRHQVVHVSHDASGRADGAAVRHEHRGRRRRRARRRPVSDSSARHPHDVPRRGRHQTWPSVCARFLPGAASARHHQPPTSLPIGTMPPLPVLQRCRSKAAACI